MKYLKAFEELYNAKGKMYVDPDGRLHRNMKSMLCVDNHIGELEEDLHDLTVGKIYKINNIASYAI